MSDVIWEERVGVEIAGTKDDLVNIFHNGIIDEVKYFTSRIELFDCG